MAGKGIQKDKPTDESYLKIHHPLESLGIVRATRGDIRVEPLHKRMDPKVPFPHKHDFFQIVIVEKGRGWHRIDFDHYKISKAQCFVIKPGQVHGWSLSPDTRGYVLEFTPESFSEGKAWETDYQTKLRHLPNMLLLKDLGEEILDLASSMEQDFTDRKYGFEVLLRSYLKIFIIKLIRSTSTKQVQTSETVSTVENFRQMIDENFQKHHSVEFYSKALGLSPKALTMRISRLTGKSARQLIQERILMESKRLLIFTKSSVKEIGYQLGFEDPNYFVRFFREQVGMPPLKFRQRHQA